MIEDLAEARLAPRLTTTRYGRSYQLREVTGSTNDDARQAATAGAPDGHVVVADQQTRGRGSRGRRWSSPAGGDLYFSVVAHLDLSPSQLAPLTLAVGLATAEAVDAFVESPAQVKWPNDVWIGGLKVAGVLVETASFGERSAPAVIGIGVNVNRGPLPEPLASEATSLRLAQGSPEPGLDRAEVLAQLLSQLERRVDVFRKQGPGPILAALEARLALRGQRVRLDGEEGVFEGLSEQGAVRLRTAAGLSERYAGRLRPA